MAAPPPPPPPPPRRGAPRAAADRTVALGGKRVRVETRHGTERSTAVGDVAVELVHVPERLLVSRLRGRASAPPLPPRRAFRLARRLRGGGFREQRARGVGEFGHGGLLREKVTREPRSLSVRARHRPADPERRRGAVRAPVRVVSGIAAQSANRTLATEREAVPLPVFGLHRRHPRLERLRALLREVRRRELALRLLAALPHGARRSHRERHDDGVPERFSSRRPRCRVDSSNRASSPRPRTVPGGGPACACPDADTRAPTGYRARRVVDVRRGGLGRIRRGSPDFPTVYFSPWVSSASARPRGARGDLQPPPPFWRAPSNHEIVRSRPTPARRDQSWWRVDARKLRGTPLAQVCVARFLARPPHARPTPAGRLWWGRETSSIASSSRRSFLSARRWLEAKPRGRASPSVRVVTRARRTPRVRRSISTCPHARPGAPTGDFPFARLPNRTAFDVKLTSAPSIVPLSSSTSAAPKKPHTYPPPPGFDRCGSRAVPLWSRLSLDAATQARQHPSLGFSR